MRFLTPTWGSRNMNSSYNNSIWEDIDRLFDDLTLATSFYLSPRGAEMGTEIVEEDDYYLLSVDLPGIKKEDVKIEVNNNVLTMSGERKREYIGDKKSSTHRHERTYGSFTKSISLPQSIDTNKIEARFEDGVLELYLPKSTETKSHPIEIQSHKGGFFEKLLENKKSTHKMKDVTDSAKKS